MVSGNRTRPPGDEEVGTLVVDGVKMPAENDVSGLESPILELSGAAR